MLFCRLNCVASVCQDGVAKNAKVEFSMHGCASWPPFDPAAPLFFFFFFFFFFFCSLSLSLSLSLFLFLCLSPSLLFRLGGHTHTRTHTHTHTHTSTRCCMHWVCHLLVYHSLYVVTLSDFAVRRALYASRDFLLLNVVISLFDLLTCVPACPLGTWPLSCSVYVMERSTL